MDDGRAGDDPDLPLLRACAGGDQHALEQLYERHSRALLAYAQGLVRDRLTAEEALQDTFLAVWRSGEAFAGRSTVRTWLFGICRRQALGRLRRHRVAESPLDEAAGLPSSDPGPEDWAVAHAQAASIGAAVVALPAGQREVLDLMFGAGLSQQEIAEVLRIPVGTVKSRLFHARAALAGAVHPVPAPAAARAREVS